MVTLNLAAGQRALDATAYSAALSFISIAQGFLSEDCWETNYELTIELFRQRAALEYLNGNFDRCSEVACHHLETRTH